MRVARRLARDRRGASSVEYALILAVVLLLGFAGFYFLGSKVASRADDTASAFSGSGKAGGASTEGDKGKSGPVGGATAAKRSSSPSGESGSAGSNGATGTATGFGMGVGMKVIVGVICGFLLLGIYFVFRNAKQGTGNKG